MWSNSMVYSVLVVVLVNIKMCQPSGRLSIQLLEYRNKKFTVKDGSCCDNTFACLDSCDNYFKICVTEDSQRKCNLGNIETKVLGDDQLKFSGISDLGGGNKNPLVFQFKKWKVVTLNIEIWDKDSFSEDDFVDTIELDIQDNPDPDSQSATANRKRLASSTSPADRYLDINVKVYCDKNFLVPDCSRQCVSRDDDHGHYTCDYVKGKVVCNKFWYGDRCTKYCRPRNDTLGNYTCDISSEKNCSVNWFGGNCSRYCRERDDENGHYKCEKNTGGKICLSKWYSEDCLTFCSARDNMEGHYYCNSTSGEKICLEKWFGANCTKHCVDEKNLSLAHFKCDVNGNRICLPGWQGQNCNKTIPPTIISSLKTSSSFHSNQHRSNTIHTRAITSSSNNNIIKTPSLNSIVSSIWNTYNQLYTPSFSDGLSFSRNLRINSTSLSLTARIFPTKSYTSLTSFPQATPVPSFDKLFSQATAFGSITSSSSVFVAKDHESRKGRASGIKETTVHMDGTAKISTSIVTVTSRQEKETIGYRSNIVSSSNIHMASSKQSRLFNVLSSSTNIQLELLQSCSKHSSFSNIVSSSTTVESKMANTKHSLSSNIVLPSTTIEPKMANTKLSLSSNIVSSSTTIEPKVANTKHSLSSNIVSSSTTIEPKMVNTKLSLSSNIASFSTTIELEAATPKYFPSFTTENGNIHATKSSSSSSKSSSTMHGDFSGVYLSPTQPLFLTTILLSRLSIKQYNRSSIAHSKPKLSKIPTTVLVQTPKPMSVSVFPHRSKESHLTELSSPPSTTKISKLSISTGINPVETIPRNATVVFEGNSTTSNYEGIAKRNAVILSSVSSVSTLIILIFFVVCVRKFHKRKTCSRSIHPLVQPRDGQNKIGLKLVPNIPNSRSDQNLLIITEI